MTSFVCLIASRNPRAVLSSIAMVKAIPQQKRQPGSSDPGCLSEQRRGVCYFLTVLLVLLVLLLVFLTLAVAFFARPLPFEVPWVRGRLEPD